MKRFIILYLICEEMIIVYSKICFVEINIIIIKLSKH